MTETFHSHVLYFPNPIEKPFDKEKYRWPSFLGEFVAKLAKFNLHKHFFCLCYADRAIFRVLTDNYDKLNEELVKLRDGLGLIDKGEEKDHTLTGSFGQPCSRFMGVISSSSPETRALKIMASLHAVTELTIDSIYKCPDGYWAFEENENKIENPIGNHLFSVNHLFHNITKVAL